MFSDFQLFFWLAFGDLIEVSIVILIVVSVAVLLLIGLDRAFARFRQS